MIEEKFIGQAASNFRIHYIIHGGSVGGIVASWPQAISLLVRRHSAEAEVIMSNKVGVCYLPSLFSWAGVTPFEAPVNLKVLKASA